MSAIRQSQSGKILAALQAGRRISALEALQEFGCFRLAARIYDLCEAGHDIRVEMGIRNGKRYAVYYLPVAPRGGQMRLADFGVQNAGY